LSGAGGGTVTLSGVGFTGDTDAQRNSRITISSGALNGIGTGDGTAVANANISIGSNGTLSGAGGGTVTLTGIGAGNFATLNTLSSSNVATYVSSSSFDSLQLASNAASTAASVTTTGATLSLSISVPAGSSAIFITYYLGPPTATFTKNGVESVGPIITAFTDSVNGGTATGVGSIIIAPTTGTHTITLTRANYDGTARLNVLVLKR
jgi:hypothetical protein